MADMPSYTILRTFAGSNVLLRKHQTTVQSSYCAVVFI